MKPGTGSKSGILLWLACWLVGISPQAAFAVTGGEVIDRIQEKLERYKTFSARFEKRFYWAVLDETRSREGRIYMKRPDRFRVELEGGDLVVADGRAIWAYSRKNRQVIVSPYAGDLKTPWEVLTDYAERFVPVAVEKVDLRGCPCYLLTLEPKNPASPAGRMRIWVDRKRWLLLKLEQMEANENVTTYLLEDHEINKKIDEKLFRFEIPDGVEVIDRRDPIPENE